MTKPSIYSYFITLMLILLLIHWNYQQFYGKKIKSNGKLKKEPLIFDSWDNYYITGKFIRCKKNAHAKKNKFSWAWNLFSYPFSWFYLINAWIMNIIEGEFTFSWFEQIVIQKFIGSWVWQIRIGLTICKTEKIWFEILMFINNL